MFVSEIKINFCVHINTVCRGHRSKKYLCGIKNDTWARCRGGPAQRNET